MNWDTLISDGWNRHANDAAEVHASLAFALATEPPPPEKAVAVGGLVVHVCGEHLGRWAEGVALLARARVRIAPGSAEDRTLWRAVAVLQRCAGDEPAAAQALAAASGDAAPDASHRARVDAVAAAAMVGQGDLSLASAWYDRACRLAAELPDEDPAIRALAVTSNNLAVALETAGRAPEDDALLRAAATNAKRFWAIAGTWLHVERAEYRLAMTHLVLEDPGAALEHAQACLDIVLANDGDAIERLFANEALAKTYHALGDPARAGSCLAVAEAALAEVADHGVRTHCEREVEKLRGILSGGRP